MSDAIEPDTKDWTWVLEEPCPECGFRAEEVVPAEIPTTVRGHVQRWVDVLARSDVAERPRPGTWSPLEYACHVRDVYRVFGERVRLMLDEDRPTFANWDQDASALEGRYGEQAPAVVAAELAEAGEATAQRFAGVPDDAWDRPGLRSNGSAFTVDTLGRYFLHDVVHHLHDVQG